MTYSLINSPSSPLTSANQICSDRESSPDLSLALQVQPGDDVMLMFQENGHVTLQQQDKDNLGKLGPGEVFVYGTQDSQSSDALVNIHNVWTPDGSGGDRRGFLLGEGGFDDGRCYQINSSPMSVARQAEFPHPAQAPQGADIWCSLNITVPSPLSSGTLTLYWVWEWPAVQQNEDVDQFYTTCMDLIVGS